MEESEKMMALKKAYAEIILNTAKEAASRVMVSERKTQLYHLDLSTTKDEALRLLLRLKQTMDYKTNEMEMKSQDQQRKIEVLEAQLQEAEDIVSSLRAELDETHMKLYKLSKTQLCNRSNGMDKAQNESEISLAAKKSDEAVLASDVARKNNGAYGDSTANNYVEESSYSDAPEIPSIISRRKEPELYPKGCTQRLRPCGGNLLKGRLKNVNTPGEDKDGEKVCVEEEESVDIKNAEEEDPVNIMQLLKSPRKINKHSSRTFPEHSFQNEDKLIEVANGDREVTTEPSISGGTLDALGSNTELGIKKPSCLKLDVKLMESSDGLSSPPSKDKFLKYTFQRKRKRDSIVGDENSLLQEENPLSGKMAKKQNGNLEPGKSGEVTPSLRDGPRMEQVARQSKEDRKMGRGWILVLNYLDYLLNQTENSPMSI